MTKVTEDQILFFPARRGDLAGPAAAHAVAATTARMKNRTPVVPGSGSMEERIRSCDPSRECASKRCGQLNRPRSRQSECAAGGPYGAI